MKTSSGRREGLTQVFLLALTVFFFFSSLVGLGSVIARYSREIGINREQAGIMYSAASLTSAVLRIPIGVIADVIGSKTFMAAGLVVAAIAGIEAHHATGLGELIATRVVQGIAIASFIAPSIAATSLIEGGAGIVSLAVSARSAAISTALIVSPLIAGILVDTIGYPAAFTYSSIVALLGLAPLLRLRLSAPRTRIGTPMAKTALRDLKKKIVLGVILVALLDGSVFISLQVLVQYEVAEKTLPATYYGIFMSIYGIVGLLSRASSGKVMSLKGPATTMVAGITAEITGLILLAFLRQIPPAFYASAALLGAGLGLVVTSEQYLLVTNTSRQTRNTLASIYAVAVDVGGGLGSILYTAIASLSSYTTTYLSMALAELTAASIAVTTIAKNVTRQFKQAA